MHEIWMRIELEGYGCVEESESCTREKSELRRTSSTEVGELSKHSSSLQNLIVHCTSDIVGLPLSYRMIRDLLFVLQKPKFGRPHLPGHGSHRSHNQQHAVTQLRIHPPPR